MSKSFVFILSAIGLSLVGLFFWAYMTESGRQAGAEAAARHAEVERSRAATRPDPFRIAAEEWLVGRTYGALAEIRSAPDWAEGPRRHVRAKDGTSFLFYFSSENVLCTVWTQQPREPIWNSGTC